MGTYIINFDDKPWKDLNDEQYYRCKEIPWFSTTKTSLHRLIPYTELDLDAIRKEEYYKGFQAGSANTSIVITDNTIRERIEEAYQQGLNDAWEAAKKIAVDADHGGLSAEALREIFSVGIASIAHIFDNFSASEAIEKIRQYEQEKEDDHDREKVVALADDIGIHKLYALVREIRGE